MVSKFYEFTYALNVFIQSCLSFVFPAALFIVPAWALVCYCSVGKWIYIPAIILGVVSGSYSIFKYAATYTKYMSSASKSRGGRNSKPTSKNKK